MPSHGHIHRHIAARGLDEDVSHLGDEVGNMVEAAAQEVETIISVVYVTASKTFSGSVAGYSTLSDANTDDNSSSQTKVADTKTKESTKTTTTDAKSTASADTDSKSATESATSTPTEAASTTIKAPSSSLSVAASIVVASSTSALNSATSTLASSSASATSSAAASSSSGGMSSVGIAGLVIGLLLGIGAISSIIFYYFRKRHQDQERLDDEKRNSDPGFGRRTSMPPQSSAAAPRLSLRPVTQLFATFNGEKSQNQGNNIAMTAEKSNQNQWDNDRRNPFGNHAEVDPVNARGAPVIQSMAPSGEPVHSTPSPTPAMAAAAATSAAASPAATATPRTLARGASIRGNTPQPLDLTKRGPARGAPSPVPTEYSVSSDTPGTPVITPGSAAITAAGGPPIAPVHRVQLDFKPSLDDELELRAGQLIRLLKEYDDGWALCIRLDRSQQGVVPRTCLSTRPVKPRTPGGPPRAPAGPGMRGSPGGPQGPGQQRPMSPAQGPYGPGSGPAGRSMTPIGQARPMTPSGQARPMTPSGQPRPMTPSGQARPMTPTGQARPMTPTGQDRPRSPSVSQMQGPRASPPGPSPMNPHAPQAEVPMALRPQNTIERKPAPGQAL